MNGKSYVDELERALDRPDADELCQNIDAYAAYHTSGGGDWPEEHSDAFNDILASVFNDPDRALAYVVLGASRTDDAGFVGLLGCLLLEDILDNPSDALLARIVEEARRSKRFCWLLSNPYKVAIATKAWDAIAEFRITGTHEEPSNHLLPPRAGDKSKP